ncbi:hemolysin family protein [Oecophyllibacter saccharovorans]|uniref:HlyC/CorC family transporter n=1 Tax=Oecophyllibacter saccharovorans TaxID=2558360 RepID=A0A506UM49_9PROT|nr:hemolysin family protein [Oecophyllibacter saccharovorans]QDH15420.1 HlyC/CorC family transporter [Oecophyllibacter saccharovorans]TPW34253.1 HlyC/CorC family transporter [Oecophyllibacter saccharovorans]TPW36440.1 HlyC/CorC family transporter [Oecophyllibacter saccharovorans]
MLTALLVILLLVLLNGVFATGELALISVKKSRLEQLARQGVPGAERAVKLASSPQNFLPTVQIGMTLVSILEGAFGGSGIEETVRHWIEKSELLRPFAGELSIILVVALITFVMLVFGELVPKQIALYKPEVIAIRLSGVLTFLAWITKPVVWLLSKTSSLVLQLLGINPLSRSALTEEELRAVLLDGTQAGILDSGEREMIERLLRLADRPVRAIMTPRNELFWIDRNADHETLVRKLRQSSYARMVVCEGDIDHPVGVILAKDIMDRLLLGLPLSIDAVLRKAPVIPDSLTAQGMIERLRGISLGIVFVMDEYGTFEGIVTPSDVFEAIIGEESHHERHERHEKHDDMEEYEFDGFMPADEVASRLDIPPFPEGGTYHTLGGAIMALLKRVPARGDKVVYGGWLFEVLKMDRRRVLLVRATRRLLARN